MQYLNEGAGLSLEAEIKAVPTPVALAMALDSIPPVLHSC